MSNGTTHSHPSLTQPELRRVAVDAGCDPRTVIRYLRDQPMTSTASERIARALAGCGYGRLVKPSRHARRDSTPPPTGT